jgi:hypothetical protein
LGTIFLEYKRKAESSRFNSLQAKVIAREKKNEKQKCFRESEF